MSRNEVLRVSACPALQLQLLLLTRATSCPGADIATWIVDHDDIAASVHSGSVPGHTSRIRAPGAVVEWGGRHAEGLRPLRALAFGRWEPSHVWIQAASDESVPAVVEAAKQWGPARIVMGLDPTDPHRSADIVELRFALPAPDAAPAPHDAVKSLRDDPPAGEATPQEVQFELLRRTRFNDFDGARVAKDLLAHRDLWRAAIVGRDDVVLIEAGERRTHATPFWNTLRLLPEEEDEGYNVDQLWILTPDREAGRALLDIARRRWRCDERKLWNRASSRTTAACVGDERVLSLWWD